VQHVVNECPVEILDRRQPEYTGHRLVKIDQSEPEVEQARQHVAVGHHEHETERAEEDVEQVVRRRSTRKTVPLRNEKPGDTDQY